MDYHQAVIVDFARRTRENLLFIEHAEEQGASVFEVTQLANSMLGLLIFPQQRYMNHIPETPLSDLVEQGWPEIKPTEGKLEKDNLKQLVRTLRNSLAHCNVEFIANHEGHISGLRLWNTPPRQPKVLTWKAELSLADLRTIAMKFIGLIEDGVVG